MISDKEIARQILEREVMKIYNQLPTIGNKIGMNVTPILSMFENKILGYADIGIETALTWLFGTDGNVDEAADIAKMMVNDKIEEYRKKVKEQKESLK
jgi:hypothetical protein